jgi:hypothetical protein
LIGVIDVAAAFADAGCAPPREEFGISFHVGGKVEKLLRLIGEHTRHLVTRHDLTFPSWTGRMANT